MFALIFKVHHSRSKLVNMSDCQTALILMRRRVNQHLIWIETVFIWLYSPKMVIVSCLGIQFAKVTIHFTCSHTTENYFLFSVSPLSFSYHLSRLYSLSLTGLHYRRSCGPYQRFYNWNCFPT